MRTKNASRNMLSSLFLNAIIIIVGFFAQAIFLKLMGAEYLGINGLFTNVVSMLGIVELGIGSAIIYHLYKPIATKDIPLIKALMNFYKKAYHLIALLIFLLGLILIPFLPLFVKEVTLPIHITFVYLLFIIDIIASYLLSYKRSILYADQKNYIINIVHIFYIIFLNTMQLLILYFTKNYYAYLLIKIVMRILENVIITIIVNKKYTYLKEESREELEKEIKDDIYKKVKALVFHKIGSFIVLGTDNILISQIFGVITVGLYSNYSMIINATQTLSSQALTSLTPSVGNLLTEKNTEKTFNIFKKIRFLNFCIALIASTLLLLIMDSFITIWIGQKYILAIGILIALVMNFYQQVMRNSYSIFKEAAGIFYEDRFVPLVESILNIIASIILAKLFGLAGIFMGTWISSLALWGYSYPKFVYKGLLKRNYISYIKETSAYTGLFIVTLFLSYSVASFVKLSNIWLDFIGKLILSIVIPLIILTLVFHKSENWKYFQNFFIERIKRREKKL